MNTHTDSTKIVKEASKLKMSEASDHIRTNTIDATRIDIDDETSIEIEDIENLDGSEIQSNEDVETEANTHNTNLRSEKGNLENEKAILDNKESCKGKVKNDFAIYNLRSPDQNPFQRQRSILVYKLETDPLPTEDEHFPYNPASRNVFIRKVFTFLFIMLCFTIVCAVAGKRIWSFTNFLKSLIGLLMFNAMLALTFVIQYIIYCSKCARSSPMVYIFLILTTLGYSYVIAFITIRFSSVIVLGAFFATAGIALICMLLAMTSFDFTKYLLYVIVISIALSAGLVTYYMGKSIFGFYMSPFHISFLIAATVVNSIMLVMELQMILGGRTVEFKDKDHAFAAHMLYTCIITLFLDFLRLIGVLKR